MDVLRCYFTRKATCEAAYVDFLCKGYDVSMFRENRMWVLVGVPSTTKTAPPCQPSAR